jgi:sec-independent protein translocase protein TatB
MEILGIGPGEFVLILIVLLVVVGPERLPGLARQAGQFLVRARNWLQTSPDAALVMRARAEIEAELASIKNSLMEVQVVRDEVLGAARQFEDSVGSLAPPKLDLNNLVNPPAEQTIAANGQAVQAGEAPTLAPDGTTAAGTPLDQRSTLDLPDDSSVPTQLPAEAQPRSGAANGLAHGRAEPTVAASATPALGELESINIRLQAIMADMWALQQQLKQRGALDETWQPPSLDVQLPTPETATPAEPPSPAEPIEDELVLAARKRLEQLTPMQVSYHTPPVIEDAPAASPPEAVPTSEAGATIEIAAQVAPAEQTTPAEQSVTKTRKRRAAATADPIAIEATEKPADGTPAAKARKRRTPAASAERTDETEPVTTEKAS